MVKSNKKIIGVGETGLDFYYNNSDKKSQIESFNNHIEAAIDLDVPLIVHSRKAELETFEILKSENKNSDLKIIYSVYLKEGWVTKFINYEDPDTIFKSLNTL